MQKKLLIVLLGFALTFAAQSQATFNIDDASVVLHQLLADASANLADLEAAWGVKLPILQNIVASLEQQHADKVSECSDLHSVWDADQQSLTNAQNYVAWLHQRIQENHERIEQLLAERCQQNNNYVEGLKNDKIALKLVAFLRQQIQAANSFSLAQRKSLSKNVKNFLAIYRSKNFAQLSSLEKQLVDASQYNVDTDSSVTDRSAEEIGVSHVDNNRGNINVADFEEGERNNWSSLQGQFLELLDNLEAHLRAKVAQAEEDELNASSAAADFKAYLEHEIETYEHNLVQWNATVAGLQVTVANDEANWNTCKSQEASLQAQLDAANQTLAEETNTFNTKQAGLREEVEVFGYVIGLYDSAVVSQDDSFKAREDDYDAQTGSFANGEYDQREVDQINLLNGF